jgi:hypothetical protein
MIEDEDDFQEKNIRKKQDKKLSKHFDIFINDEKFKILNYLFKVENLGDRKGNCIQLISKFDIRHSQRENVKIVIIEGENKIEIDGDWAFTTWNVGNYCVGYWIKNMIKK